MSKTKKVLLVILGIIVLLLAILITIFNLDSDEFGKFCGASGTQYQQSFYATECICLGEKETRVGVGATETTCSGFVLFVYPY